MQRGLKLYLAGPMTGLSHFNFPAFKEAAAALRAKGWDIVSPAELDSAKVKAAARKSKDGHLDTKGKVAGETWGQMLGRDVCVIADKVDGILFLPGWTESRGARLEAFVALLTNKTTFGWYLGAGIVRLVTVDTVRKHLKASMP